MNNNKRSRSPGLAANAKRLHTSGIEYNHAAVVEAFRLFVGDETFYRLHKISKFDMEMPGAVFQAQFEERKTGPLIGEATDCFSQFPLSNGEIECQVRDIQRCDVGAPRFFSNLRSPEELREEAKEAWASIHYPQGNNELLWDEFQSKCLANRIEGFGINGLQTYVKVCVSPRSCDCQFDCSILFWGAARFRLHGPPR